VERAGAALETQDGYDELYRRNRARVGRLCRLLIADRDEAEDVEQEVFVKLLRQFRDGEPRADWRAWLTRVTLNACRDRRRSRWWRWWRGATDEFEETRFATFARTPEEEVLGVEQRARVWQAYERLPTRQREVFVLRHVEGWSTQETADMLGLEPGSVKRHLFRAIRHLRGALGERR